MEKKIIQLYWLISFLFMSAHSFFYVTYVVFLNSKGMDLLQVNLINCFFMVGVFILEIPTGAYADLVGRKKSFIISCFCFSLSMFIYYLSETFWMFVLAELICALAAAFNSGSLEAWMVDSLKHHGLKTDLNMVFKREQQFHQFGVVIGSLIGGYIGTINLSLPWLCSSIAISLVGFYSCLVMKEEYSFIKTERLGINTMREIIGKGINYGIKKRSVLYIISFGLIFAFICQPLNMYWSLMFKNDYGFDTGKLGWVFLGISLGISFGSQLSNSFLRVFKKEKKAIILSQIITVLGVLIACCFNNLTLVLSGFLAHEVGRGIYRPLQKTYINNRIPSQQRATIISFDSMVSKIGAGLGLVISGFIAKNYSIQMAWLVSALVLAIIIPIFLKLKNGE